MKQKTIDWLEHLLLPLCAAGISGQYTWLRKLTTILLGLGGTIVINQLRIALVCLMGFFFVSPFTVAYHNYLGAGMVFVWLFIYWWISFRFILKARTISQQERETAED